MLAIDLFSGCGGLTTGLKQAGYNVTAAVEIERRACKVYSANHPEVSLSNIDIRLLSSAALIRSLGLGYGELDLLAGCPPCQSFSRLTRRNRHEIKSDNRNDLITEFVRFVLDFAPKTFLMENVPHLSTFGLFTENVDKLRRCGYMITCEVVDAANYGVPQRRKRLVLLGSRISPPKVAPRVDKQVTVREAIGHLALAGKSGDALHDMGERRSAKVQTIIKSIPPDGGSRSDLPKELELACHRRSNGFSDVYGRMRWDACAPTITSGCSNPSKGRFLHPSEDRAITLREAALLQGFPESYQFDPTLGRESLALMIGNALPPPLIMHQASSLIQGGQ